jgi:ubiquinone/menaquinone biosynthesis C-methylase UbiE
MMRCSISVQFIMWSNGVTPSGMVYRMLKPGGRFYTEEILEKYIGHPLFRRLLDHPQQDRFTRAQFAEALKQNGFTVIASGEFVELFAWFIADKPTPDAV